MMRGVASTLEKHHKVQILDEALEAAVKLSHRYIPARQLPDKAVSLLDTACARVAVSQHAMPAEVDDSRGSIEALETELGIIGRERCGAAWSRSGRREREAARDEAEARRRARAPAGREKRWSKRAANGAQQSALVDGAALEAVPRTSRAPTGRPPSAPR